MEKDKELCTEKLSEILERSNMEIVLLERLNEIKKRVEFISEVINTRTDHIEQINNDMILDFHDVCQILHLSPRQVRRFQNTELKGFLIGRKRLYRYSEIKIFINNRLNNSENGKL